MEEVRRLVDVVARDDCCERGGVRVHSVGDAAVPEAAVDVLERDEGLTLGAVPGVLGVDDQLGAVRPLGAVAHLASTYGRDGHELIPAKSIAHVVPLGLVSEE